MYAPLHVHTEHSALDGLARLDKLSAAAKDRGIEAMAITDHGSLAGVWDWDKACTKHGVKSIPGIEAYLAIGSRHQKNVVEELNDEGMGDADDDGKGETRSKKYHHLTLLAYNRQGWHNLIRLHNESQKFVWFKPRMDYELIGEYSEGLIATTGCLASPVNSPLKQIDLVGVVKMREHHSHLTSFLDTSDEEVYQQGQEEIIAYIDPLVDGWPESPGQDLRARVTLSADINPDDFDEAVNDAVGDMVDASLQRDKLWQTACDEVESLIDALGAENVYIELMNHGIEAEAAVTGYLHALSEEYGLTCVVTGDSHYIEPNDSEAHEAFLAVGTGATLADEKRFKFNGGGYHLKTYEEMCQGWEPVVEYLGIDDEEEARAWEQWWHQAVDNTMLIADRRATQLQNGAHQHHRIAVTDRHRISCGKVSHCKDAFTGQTTSQPRCHTPEFIHRKPSQQRIAPCRFGGRPDADAAEAADLLRGFVSQLRLSLRRRDSHADRHIQQAHQVLADPTCPVVGLG